MTPLYVSFFTERYAAHARDLVETLREFGLAHEVVPVTARGEWVANCAYKPTFLREMRTRHPKRPLVWLDADARIRQYPGWFDDLDCDLAAHRRGGVELLSGTLYFGPRIEATELMRAWAVEQAFFPDQWDQRTLDIVLGKVPGLKVETLPASYVKIFDAKDMGDDTVIEHLQASRQLGGVRFTIQPATE